MPNPFPIAVTGSDGITTLVGEATFTDADNQPGGDPDMFQGWTSDDANPANVASNDGDLDLDGGTLSAAAGVFSGLTSAVGTQTSPRTSGALPTQAFVSGTAAQLGAAGADADLYIPWTTDATNNAATLKLELSPDNVTYSTLATLSIAAALNTLGAVELLQTLKVPHGWWVKLTAVHSTIGTTTYVAPGV